jgi:glycerophosphoryl diester phosphodiesterase
MSAPPGEFRLRRARGAPPLIYAHRGASRAVLENTLAAFERGIADGADGIELDVRTTRDGVVVVLHDADLARVTDGRDVRACAALTLAELRTVELRDGHRVPTLAEVLDLAAGRGALVNVELKHDAHDLRALAFGVGRVLAGRPRAGARVHLSSFEPKLLGLAALAMPKIPRALLVHHGQRLARTPGAAPIARAFAGHGLHPERTLCDPHRMRAWRRWGARWLNVWTVNDPSEARDLAALGVDGLITDAPDTLWNVK